ncbi:MAG: hypothetical protein QOF73_2921 [Thermomicrobiales bacterium]|jgi:hypothetical protein|nr:hypothetical protein [Thermomicrobiales bacterium]
MVYRVRMTWRPFVKPILLLLAVIVFFSVPATAEASSGSTVSVSIEPGPFTATIIMEDGLAVLTVEDATGSARGWWVSVSCTCQWVRLGKIETVAGDAAGGPHWEGATLVADVSEGIGIYRQAISASAETWLITSAQGERP